MRVRRWWGGDGVSVGWGLRVGACAVRARAAYRVCVCVACVRKLATALWIWQFPFFAARVLVCVVWCALRWSERRFKCLLGSRGEGGACAQLSCGKKQCFFAWRHHNRAMIFFGRNFGAGLREWAGSQKSEWAGSQKKGEEGAECSRTSIGRLASHSQGVKA